MTAAPKWPALVSNALVVTIGAAFVAKAIDPRPVLVLGLGFERVTVTLALLVTIVGALVVRFSARHLSGDPRRQAFMGELTGAIVAAAVLMLADHLVLLFVAWTAISLVLHRMLTHYSDRPAAVRAARKKFLISRLGDLALVAAIASFWNATHTFSLREGLAALALMPEALASCAWLVALAAITKSAQFPFHTWLPETLDSPTPVSAIMHAGIINGGGALLLKFSPLLVRVPSAGLLLAAIGSLTMLIGMVTMWHQSSVKRRLAWSTVAQMGFMTAECGAGVFAAALLHIVGHGLYKAASFLRAGTLPNPTMGTARRPGWLALGMVATLPAFVIASTSLGLESLHSPADWAIGWVLALAVGEGWALLGPGRIGELAVRAATSTATVLVALMIYAAASRFFLPDLPAPNPSPGGLGIAAAWLPAAAITFLSLIHALLPTLAETPSGARLQVHARNGFYFGTVADRIVAGLSRKAVTV